MLVFYIVLAVITAYLKTVYFYNYEINQALKKDLTISIKVFILLITFIIVGCLPFLVWIDLIIKFYKERRKRYE